MRSQQQPLPSIIRTGGPAIAAWAAVLLALAPLSARAQSIFPPNEPRVIYNEDVSARLPSRPADGREPVRLDPPFGGGRVVGLGRRPAAAPSGGPTSSSPMVWRDGSSGGMMQLIIPTAAAPGARTRSARWGGHRSLSSTRASPATPAISPATGRTSVSSSISPATPTPPSASSGAPRLAATKVDHGYLFYIDELPTQTQAVD